MTVKLVLPKKPVKARRTAKQFMRAKYDAAQTTDENRKHWSHADGLSADAAASPGVRRVLRNRARYEVSNNSYARGIVSTIANDCVGTGPRLQMLGIKKADATFVEGEFQKWATSVDLAEKLRTMRMARAVDGESLGIMYTNEELLTPVKLDIRLIEAEQVASPGLLAPTTNMVDGIHFDDYGNPKTYDVLKEHPGNGVGLGVESFEVSARDMLHYFATDRPGQRRGIPELTPALPLFAQLRRWTLSVLAAAETASDFSALLYTENPIDQEDADAFDRVEIERRGMMTLPAGYKMSQLKAEQPVSTYKEFKSEILNEIARCLNTPFNIAAGNSAGYNYSSGKLDWQIYFKMLRVDRARLINQVIDRIFSAWVREAILIEGYLPQSLRTVRTDWAHTWFFDGFEHVDPKKEADAQTVRLANNTTTLADEWGAKGKDWEEQLEQRCREKAKQKELEKQYKVKLSEAEVRPTVTPVNEDEDEDGEEANEEDAEVEEEVAV